MSFVELAVTKKNGPDVVDVIIIASDLEGRKSLGSQPSLIGEKDTVNASPTFKTPLSTPPEKTLYNLGRGLNSLTRS
jgi:hypothetical protein